MEIIEELRNTKIETLKYFELTGEDLLKNYGPGKWNIRNVLHHIADSESILFYRIRRVISEPRQVIWACDADAWAKQLDYPNVPLELAKSVYASSREGILYYAGKHYERSAEVSFVHSEAGIRTLKDEFDKVVVHNRQHLADIKKALI